MKKSNQSLLKYLVIPLFLLLGLSGTLFSQTITITGADTVGPGAQTKYEASLNYDPNPSSTISWSITHGTIVSQNVNPASTIYCIVQWDTTVTTGYVYLYEVPPFPYESHSGSKTVDLTCEVADAGSDQGYCVSGSVTIGTPGIPGYTYSWSPTTGLDYSNIAQPTASPSSTTTYTLTMSPVNLFTNGDFESGLTGFTTDYGIYPNGNGSCGGFGVFGSVAVTTNPFSLGTQYCSKTDHSPVGTNMLFVDGSCRANDRVWSETVTVVPNSNYYFNGWASPNSDDFGFPNLIPILRVRINGNNVISNFPVIWGAVGCSNWQQFSAIWNSGSSTSATIEIIDDNLNGLGNDFSLDDIFFTNCAITIDDVTVTVGASTPSVTPIGPITYYNQYESVLSLVLTCNDAPSYQWYKNNTVILGATSKTYTIEFQGGLTYTDYYKCVTSCGTSNTVTFNYVGCFDETDYPVPVPPNGTCLSNYPLSLIQPNMGTGGMYYWDTWYHPSCYYFSDITGINDNTALFNSSGCPSPYTAESILTRAVATNGTEIRMQFGGTADGLCKPGNHQMPRKIINKPDPDVFALKNINQEKIIMRNTQYRGEYDTLKQSIRKTIIISANKNADLIKIGKATLFPNPANSQVTIITKDAIQQIQIFNIVGNVMKQIKNDGSAILVVDIQTLLSGIYFCKVFTNKGVEYLKFAVQR